MNRRNTNYYGGNFNCHSHHKTNYDKKLFKKLFKKRKGWRCAFLDYILFSKLPSKIIKVLNSFKFYAHYYAINTEN